MRTLGALFLLMLSLPALANLPPQLQAGLNDSQPQFLPVDEAFRFDWKFRDGELTAYWQIADGYYLYRKQFAFVSDQSTLGQPQFPAGEMYEDDYFGQSEVFKYNLSVPLAVDLPQGQAAITVRYQGCATAGLCYPPVEKVITLEVPPTAIQPAASVTPLAGSTAPNADGLAAQLASGNMTLTLGLFFVLGLGLAFTPCVFPMYPILSGVIGGHKDLTSRKAFALSLSYVQGMALTYTLLGVVVALAGLQFQAALQHPAVLVGISLLFVALALSMFGLYEIRMPSRWQSKLNEASHSQRRGHFGGAFVMGAISGLVASPCTSAPLSGALLFIAQSGNVALGAGALYALSLGMGLPLLLLGSSAGKLLPKSGAWMTVVKSLFGFGLLAVAVLFLERILAAQITLLLWAILMVGVAGYFIWLARGLSGWRYGLTSVLMGLSLLTSGALSWQAAQQGQHPVDEGHALAFTQISSIAELDTQLALARDAGQPVMLDFYADWCVSCKEFEQYTFADPKVQDQLASTRLLQADVTRNTPESMALLERLDILGLPTLVFFDNSGQETRELRVTGFMDARQFSAHLNQR